MQPLIYLAGPISGLTYDGCTDWRKYAEVRFNQRGILAASPMRAKEHLREYGVLHDGYEDHPLSTERGIMTRDRNDVTRCDLVFANLLGAKIVSIGTVMELAWADILRKPVVLCIEDKGNIHDHPMLREATGFRVVSDLDEALSIAEAVLAPANHPFIVRDEQLSY